MVNVRTEEEYAKAVEDKEDYIEVTAEMREKIITIKAVASAVAATTSIGMGATTAAIALAVAAGGTEILTATRNDYDIVEQDSHRIVLKRR